ncbi:hypothetical protein [Virgibacillus sp. MG-45]|uniref:hypothetical protein n=1 Tax=Virgibacillus sp. MG-45 TaxID=3102791 RepID=UPI002EDA8C9F
MKKVKISILITSFLLILFFSFYFNIGHRTEGDEHVYGFPADWLVLYKEGDLASLKLLSLLFNGVFFYFITLWIIKISKKVYQLIKKKK